MMERSGFLLEMIRVSCICQKKPLNRGTSFSDSFENNHGIAWCLALRI